MTGRAPALLNKNAAMLDPVLGIPPHNWVKPDKNLRDRAQQWRERREEALSLVVKHYGASHTSVSPRLLTEPEELEASLCAGRNSGPATL